MTVLEISECWRCSNCGHVVIEDGCGFTYSNNQVQTCERCPDVPVIAFAPILNEAEKEKESP